MLGEDRNISKNRHGEKSLKAPFIIYADLECLLKQEQSCQNSPKKSYTERKSKYEPLGYSWGLICSFDATKNRRNIYRGKVLQRFKRACNRNNQLQRKRNDTTNG